MRLILLPGMDGTGNLFKPLLSELPDNIKTDIISYPSDSELNYQELENYVKEILPSTEEFILVAESFSGVVAYNIAKNAPQNLKSIIFVASFLTSPHLLSKLFRWMPWSTLLKLPIPNVTIKHYLLGPGINQDTLALFKKTIKQISRNVLANRLKKIVNLHIPLETLSVPCTYLQATNDKLVPSHNLESFISICHGLEVVRIAGPHFILQAKPAECAAVILKEYISRSKRAV